MRSLPAKRNSDGTFRNGNKPRKTTVRTMRARWVEAEGLRLKQMGMSYEAIAGISLRSDVVSSRLQLRCSTA